MSFAKAFVLFTLALSASAFATPRAAHNPLHHRDLAARLASPEPAPVPVVYEARDAKPLRKRSSRCKASSSSSAVSSTPTVPVGNQESAPPTSSSIVAAPKPTSTKKATTEEPKPTPTSTKQTSTHTTAAPAPTSNEPVYLQGTNTGDGTFYSIGLGACGIYNSGNDKIVAVSKLLFDTYPGYNGENPNDNPVCNRPITAHYQGKTVQVTATDRCEACAIEDLDFSPAAFSELADFSVGRIHGMTWTFD